MTNEEAAGYKVDKTGWGDGPWQTEPDRVDFVHAGFACLALRHPRHGYWCGYAGVPAGHPMYGVNWTDGCVDLHCHHGINYSAACDGLVCHAPAPGMPDDVWWIGFDCGHLFDLAPGMASRERAMFSGVEFPAGFSEVYRDLPYVRRQIETLAEQLRAAAVNSQPGSSRTAD